MKKVKQVIREMMMGKQRGVGEDRRTKVKSEILMSGIGAWYRQFKNEYEYFNEVSAPIPILVSVSVHP